MNVRRRSTEVGVTGSGAKNATNQMSKQPNNSQAIKNSVAMKPSKVGYSKIKGAVTG